MNTHMYSSLPRSHSGRISVTGSETIPQPQKLPVGDVIICTGGAGDIPPPKTALNSLRGKGSSVSLPVRGSGMRHTSGGSGCICLLLFALAARMVWGTSLLPCLWPALVSSLAWVGASLCGESGRFGLPR